MKLSLDQDPLYVMLYLTLSFREPTVFWITNPLVTFENNVAAGTEVCSQYINIKDPIYSTLLFLGHIRSKKGDYSIKQDIVKGGGTLNMYMY